MKMRGPTTSRTPRCRLSSESRIAFVTTRFSTAPDGSKLTASTSSQRQARTCHRSSFASCCSALLEDRFQLVARREQREVPVLVLLPGRSDARVGPGLKSVLECPRGTAVQRDSQAVPAVASSIGGCGPARSAASMVSQHMQTTVIDKTGLVGTYETFLFFAPDAASANAVGVPDLPSFPAAVREQWGFKLESGRGLVDVLVIDSVSQPTEN